MIILGIDPGIGRSGWGIIQKTGSQVKAIAYGCIETTNEKTTPERLLILHTGIQTLLLEYQPQVLAIEELFFNTNAKTALIVGQARGVILLGAAQSQTSIAVYTPLQVKIAVAGYGRAEKKQVGQMVKTLLKLSDIPKPDDVTDALAIALTHAFSAKAHLK